MMENIMIHKKTCCWSSHLNQQAAGVSMWDFKAHIQWHTVSSMKTPTVTRSTSSPITSQVVPLPNDQAFKSECLWGPFLFKPQNQYTVCIMSSNVFLTETLVSEIQLDFKNAKRMLKGGDLTVQSSYYSCSGHKFGLKHLSQSCSLTPVIPATRNSISSSSLNSHHTHMYSSKKKTKTCFKINKS